jgi:Lantibiotic dehydratase, N terminus
MTTHRAPAEHEVALGGTGWHLWRDVCLRSAGFPARRVLALRADELADAADRLDGTAGAHGQTAYEAAYRAATGRLPRTVAGIATDPLFREAVTWQNPDLVTNCLDRITGLAPRNVKGRKRELMVTAYLQRYGLKNDTIGFFGPVGWASLCAEGDAVTLTPGPSLLGRRTTYFETWAIDRVGQAVAGLQGVFGWLRPRRDPSGLLVGNHLHRPRRRPVALSAAQFRMLMRCDGRRTVSELLATPEPDALAVLTELRDLGALRIDLAGPAHARPEDRLRLEIEGIGDPAVRAAALRPLEEIVAAQEAVATAAGDPDKLQRAMATLTEAFHRVTGGPATRGAGRAYAGRTLVYEDTVRDVEVRLGPAVVAAMARPLGLVLDSASWLVSEVTERYRAMFSQMFDRECARTRTDRVPLSRLIIMATPDVLTPSKSVVVDVVASVLEEFQERWENVLQLPRDHAARDHAARDHAARRHRVHAADIAGAAAELFPARPAAWSLARQHSPDVMIAAASAEAVCQGEFLVVLGELHLAANTLESRCFVEQHPDQARMLEAASADHGGRRVVAIPPKDSPFVTSRLNPPTALASPRYTYWSSGNDAIVPPEPAQTLPAASLLVTRNGGDLVVRCASSGTEFPFFEFIGDVMTGIVASAFRPIAPRSHQPRISIDRFVLSREAWTFAVGDVPWAFVKDEARRYALARRWRAEHRLPERVFYKVPVEDQPMAADFRSLPLVNLFAKGVRRSKDAGLSSFTVSEMAPDMDQLWLTDSAGERYTCELRFVATSADEDERGASRASDATHG